MIMEDNKGSTYELHVQSTPRLVKPIRIRVPSIEHNSAWLITILKRASFQEVVKENQHSILALEGLESDQSFIRAGQKRTEDNTVFLSTKRRHKVYAKIDLNSDQGATLLAVLHSGARTEFHT